MHILLLATLLPLLAGFTPLPTPQPQRSTFLFSTQAEDIQSRLNNLYNDASETIRCPFFKRRAADTIDGMAEILRFLQVSKQGVVELRAQQYLAGSKKRCSLIVASLLAITALAAFE